MDEVVRWIEAEELADDNNTNEKDDDDDDQPDIGNLFADPDPFDTFHFTFGNTRQILIRGHKMENGQTLHSTGLTLWRASPLLCEYMVSQQEMVHNKTVLELGAGLGLCGILAHRLGARHVVLTDGDSDTLALLRENVATNVTSWSNHHDTRVECRQLRWGHEFATSFLLSSTHQPCFDILLASDVIYVEECIEPLLETVVALLAPNGVFWLSYARRNVSIDKVLYSAGRHGLSWTLPNEAAEGVHVFSRLQLQHASTTSKHVS